MSRTKRRQKGNPRWRNLTDPMIGLGNKSTKFKTNGQFFQSDCVDGNHTQDLKAEVNAMRRCRERIQLSEIVKHGIDSCEDIDYDISHEQTTSRTLQMVHLW